MRPELKIHSNQKASASECVSAFFDAARCPTNELFRCCKCSCWLPFRRHDSRGNHSTVEQSRTRRFFHGPERAKSETKELVHPSKGISARRFYPNLSNHTSLSLFSWRTGGVFASVPVHMSHAPVQEWGRQRASSAEKCRTPCHAIPWHLHP